MIQAPAVVVPPKELRQAYLIDIYGTTVPVTGILKLHCANANKARGHKGKAMFKQV
jgi:hypothetical protein